MGWFDLIYTAEDDALEVSFQPFEQRLARSLALNDHIYLFTDPSLRNVWGLTFYAYSQLLGVNETEFTGLRELANEEVTAILELLVLPPARHFIELTNPEGLIARVLAPGLQELVMET
jgi:hypothetical protein